MEDGTIHAMQYEKSPPIHHRQGPRHPAAGFLPCLPCLPCHFATGMELASSQQREGQGSRGSINKRPMPPATVRHGPSPSPSPLTIVLLRTRSPLHLDETSADIRTRQDAVITTQLNSTPSTRHARQARRSCRRSSAAAVWCRPARYVPLSPLSSLQNDRAYTDPYILYYRLC